MRIAECARLSYHLVRALDDNGRIGEYRRFSDGTWEQALQGVWHVMDYDTALELEEALQGMVFGKRVSELVG